MRWVLCLLSFAAACDGKTRGSVSIGADAQIAADAGVEAEASVMDASADASRALDIDAQGTEDGGRDAYTRVVDATADTSDRVLDAETSEPSVKDASTDGSEDASTDAGQDASSDAGEDGVDASEPPLVPCDPADYPTTYTVPADGGAFRFCAASGAVVTFEFPYLLAGLEVSARNVDPTARAWPNPGFAAAFRDVIALEPLDLQLTQAVGVRLPRGSVLAFVFNEDLTVPTPLVKPVYRPLPELRRLGTLAIVAAERSCETEPGAPFSSGWSDALDTVGWCSAYPEPQKTRRLYVCPSAPFCHDGDVWCCVPNGAPPGGCNGDDTFTLAWSRAASERDYCQEAGGAPYVSSVTPNTLIANHIDQTVEVTGAGFRQGGYVTGARSTEWISSTRVRAVLDGAGLTNVGPAQPIVGYVNPLPGGAAWQFETDLPSNRLDVTLVPPTVVCPLPPRYASDPPWNGQCTRGTTTCGCSVDFDPGDGVHRYAMDCDANARTCICTRDGVSVNSISSVSSYVCGQNHNLGATWRESCAWRAGFCP